MKIFHTENGQETVYVQMQDIIYVVNETDIPIPASIINKVFTGVIIVTDENLFDFVKFDEKLEVKFFRKLDFIIDFNQYNSLTDEQLGEEAQKLRAKANKIAEKWNSMTEKEKRKNRSLYEEYHNIDYMIRFLSEIYAVKHGKRNMPFPEFGKTTEKPKKKRFFSIFSKKM